MKLLLLAMASLALAAQTGPLESRGSADWPTANHFRVRLTSNAPAGQPLSFDLPVPERFNPDSVRVYAATLLAAKTDYRRPTARILFVSTGAPAYHVYFDTLGHGETRRLVEPAMIGAGDRLTFGRAAVRARLSVGLWAYPAAIDMNADGRTDLIVSCTDRPYNGTYLFLNLGTNSEPLFDRAEWLGPAVKELYAADFNGDNLIDLATPGGYFSDVVHNCLSHFVKVDLPRSYFIGRDDLWVPVDWDHDGRIDLLTGVSDWRDYGWDDAFNARGEWTRGPLHGYVYFHRNRGTNSQPAYEPPVKLLAGGREIDQYGAPAPNPVDWFATGRLDLLLGNFIDRVFLARNNGAGLDAVEPLRRANADIRLDLCMIQPRAVRWHGDSRPSLLVGEEDGRVVLFENQAPAGQPVRLAAPKYLEQVDPFVKSGALSRPVAFDWNGDGLLDLIAGNSAGYIEYFENTGTREAPAFTARGPLQAAGRVIRHIAGPNGSIQGPAEEKWGYTNPWVADWDLDGRPDLLVNDITGAVVWYRNTGTRREPSLEAARPVEVEWNGPAPKPEWLWWTPKGKQLVTQWRTTPCVVDWDRDGLPDLVMLNHQGYLALFRRTRVNGELRLLPPERIFVEPGGRFFRLASGLAGSSGRRKVDTVDWDGDGDLDLITDSDEGPVLYENEGTQAKPVMRNRGPILKTPLRGHNPTPHAADWNGDGRPDLLIGAEDGFFYYYERSFIEAQRR